MFFKRQESGREPICKKVPFNEKVRCVFYTIFDIGILTQVTCHFQYPETSISTKIFSWYKLKENLLEKTEHAKHIT